MSHRHVLRWWCHLDAVKTTQCSRPRLLIWTTTQRPAKTFLVLVLLQDLIGSQQNLVAMWASIYIHAYFISTSISTAISTRKLTFLIVVSGYKIRTGKFCQQHHILQWTPRPLQHRRVKNSKTSQTFSPHVTFNKINTLNISNCVLNCRVLQDISESVVAVYTLKGTHSSLLPMSKVLNLEYLFLTGICEYIWKSGAHCLDLGTPMPSDPDWLVAQRDKEIKIVALWLAEYNAKRPTS